MQWIDITHDLYSLCALSGCDQMLLFFIVQVYVLINFLALLMDAEVFHCVHDSKPGSWWLAANWLAFQLLSGSESQYIM